MATEAARQKKEQQRLAREKYLADRTAEAAARTADVDRRMRELDGVLAAALATPVASIDFARMKKPRPVVPLDLGRDAIPLPPPAWEDFEPPPARGLTRLFGGRDSNERQLAERRSVFEQERARHAAAETARQQRVRAAREEHARRQATADERVAAQHAKVDRFAAAVRAGERHAASRYLQYLLDRLRDPAGFPRQRRAGYVPESTLLAIEWWMPGVEVIPTHKIHKYVKASDEIKSTARPLADTRETYRRLVSQIALRALHTVFTADPYALVNTVVFNGMVQAIEPSTGQQIEPCLITLRATRDQFTPLVLTRVDPIACVRKYFAADVSPHPDELQPVEPVMSFDMADPRIIDPVDVISGMDKRPNLLQLSPKEFESFIQNLFTLMGLDTKQYQARGDGGVDCMAYDRRAILGGKYAIQAKLYTKTVDPSAVRDLYGTVQHEGATKGILITTSGYGPSSYEFANGKNLQLIDGSGLLALCREHNVPARIAPIAGPKRR